MKQIPDKLPLIIILLSAMFVIGLRLGIHCGKDIGYNQGWLDCCDELQASMDSISKDYIRARDSYSAKLDSLIEEYDKP